MKEVKVRTRYDFRAFKYCNWYMLKYNRKVYLIYILLTIFSIGAAIGLFFLNGNNGAADGAEQTGGLTRFLFPAVFILFGVYAIYQMITLESKLDKNIARHFSNHEPFEQVVEFSEEKIRIFTDDGKEPFDYDWAFITEIHRIKEYYFLKINTTFLMVDRSPEALVEGTSEDLDAIMDERGSTKPYKKFDGEVVTKPITFEHTYVAPVNTAEAEVVNNVEYEDEAEIVDDDNDDLEEVENVTDKEDDSSDDESSDVEESENK